MLVKVDGKDAVTVHKALKKRLRQLPQEVRKSLTWDRGSELSKHKELSVATHLKIYFCDPGSPWQRGTNENTNGLLRQYMPKKTNLGVYTQTDLSKIARELNGRPRKTLGFKTPLKFLTKRCIDPLNLSEPVVEQVPQDQDSALLGKPVSRGVVTAKARVVRTLEEAAALQAGDLVTLDGNSGSLILLDEPRNRMYVMSRYLNRVYVIDLTTEVATSNVRMNDREPAHVALAESFFTTHPQHPVTARHRAQAVTFSATLTISLGILAIQTATLRRTRTLVLEVRCPLAATPSTR